MAIQVEGLGKTYRLGSRERTSTAAEAMLQWLRRPQRQKWTTFDALNDVTFSVAEGEALGIVGRNGAGKSTLLKLLTQVAAPTRGKIEFRGRVGSLLEVGTGFHPELTGRENIFLNGALLGMTRAEIRRRYDEIVDFSGVAQFLETPLKRYSSGMYVRLAFAVAAHLDTEILAIDEVLAVGDAEFQRRSLGKMRDASDGGRTVLYVSHQLQTVQNLCTSAIFLDRGRLLYHGSVEGALDAYRKSFAVFAEAQADPANRSGSGELRFTSVGLASNELGDIDPGAAQLRSGDEISIDFRVGANTNMAGQYYVSAHVSDDGGGVIAQCDSRLLGWWLEPTRPQEGRLAIKNLWLKPGRYTVDLYACQSGVLDAWDGAWQFEILPDLPYPQTAGADGLEKGTIFADFTYESI